MKPTALKPAEVMNRAREVANMVTFFSLLGSAILAGRSRNAYRMLVAIPLTPKRAWQVVDTWELTLDHETQTGWTPEAAAIAIVMNDVAAWRVVEWHTLLMLLATVTPTK